MSHCEMRVAMDHLAYSILEGYRKILYALWAPRIGEIPFEKAVYSELWPREGVRACANESHHLCYSAGVMVLSKEHPREIRPHARRRGSANDVIDDQAYRFW